MGLDCGRGSVEGGRSRSQSHKDRASSVGHTQILHVEVNDVMTWYKINVGIGKTFFVDSLCKSAMHSDLLNSGGIHIMGTKPTGKQSRISTYDVSTYFPYLITPQNHFFYTKVGCI